MASSSKKSKMARGSRRKKDFDLKIETPFGKASLNHRASRAIRTSLSAPVSKGTVTKSLGPKIMVSGRTETVCGSGTFLSIPVNTLISDHGLSAPVNPGLAEFFPWLNNTAKQFSRYVFTKLVFTFISRVPTTSVGDLLLMGDPNVQNNLPSTFVDAVSYEGAVYGNVWTSVKYDAKLFCNQPKYVRLGPLTEGQDSKTYDVGKIGYLLAGFSDEISAGYITVDYEVTFMDRRIPPETGCFLALYRYPVPLTLDWNMMAIFEQPNPNPILLTHVNSDGGSYLGFPKGFWIMSFSYIPEFGDSLNVDGSMPDAGFNFSSNGDRCRLLTRTDTPLDLMFGSDSRAISGYTTGTPSLNVGATVAYWAVLANSSAVPQSQDITFGPGGMPPGWIEMLMYPDGFSSDAWTTVTAMVCKMPEAYASYLGFDIGIPTVLPRVVRSEIQTLNRGLKFRSRASRSVEVGTSVKKTSS